MTISWTGLIVGAILGAVLGIIVKNILTTRTRRQRLQRKYGHLTGSYQNYHVVDGREEHTDGTVNIAQRPDGSFDVAGLHGSGELEWLSQVRMSLEWDRTGTGRYTNAEGSDCGLQQITEDPEALTLHVLGTRFSCGGRTTFIHRWKRMQT